MKVTVRATGAVLGHASEQLLSNNIEAYETTIPELLSDRLRNPKFAPPENPQTGVALEWEPIGNTMTGFACRLVPGMYMSGREAQLIHNYTQQSRAGIVQAGVPVRAGELYEVEMWARAQHAPVTVSVALQLPGQRVPAQSQGELLYDLAHWHRRTCVLQSPGDGPASFQITVPGDSRVVIDQVHLRPVGETHVTSALLAAVQAVPCPVLRFPGGCVTCTYHWEHGTGPVHLRPVCDDAVFKYKVHYDFGTDEYLDLCAARGIRPLLTLNTSTATPEQAGAWAAYVRQWYAARGLPIPAAYFMVGNENYGIHEIGHMTGEMYVAQLREFAPAVRAAYPEARVLAIGEYVSGGLREGQDTPWRSLLIEQAADCFDALVVTRYSGAPDDLPLPEAMAAVANALADKEADLLAQVRTLADAHLDRTIGIVEWNYWTRASHNDHAGFYEPNDIRHCLYSAGFLNALCRLGDIVELAAFYSLVNTMGTVHIHAGQFRLTDLVKVFTLYAEALPAEVLALQVDAPSLTEKRAAVDAVFLRKAGVIYGFLLNLSAHEAAEVSLEGLGIFTEARGVTAQAILEPVTEIALAVVGGRITLPPMSIVRVH